MVANVASTVASTPRNTRPWPRSRRPRPRVIWATSWTRVFCANCPVVGGARAMSSTGPRRPHDDDPTFGKNTAHGDLRIGGPSLARHAGRRRHRPAGLHPAGWRRLQRSGVVAGAGLVGRYADA